MHKHHLHFNRRVRHPERYAFFCVSCGKRYTIDRFAFWK